VSRFLSNTFTSGLIVLGLSACGEHAMVPASEGFGANPEIGSPHSTLIPTVNIAPAKGWPAGATPVAAAGLAVNAFATGLDHPRWLYGLPNGDVLVAESNAPKQHDAGSGLKGWAMKLVQKEAGAGVPSPNKIILLRDRDGDGVAETHTVFLSGLNSPFGITLVGSDLTSPTPTRFSNFTTEQVKPKSPSRG
jgi:glucose/arabinose dehydrogenase